MSFTALTLNTTQVARLATFAANLDSVFGAGANVSGTTVSIGIGRMTRSTTTTPATITVVTTTAHNFVANDMVDIEYTGSPDPNYKVGPKTIATVTGSHTFTYFDPTTGVTTAASTQPATVIKHIAQINGYADDGLMSNGIQGGPDTPPGLAGVNRVLVKGMYMSVLSALMQGWKLTQVITQVVGLPGPTGFTTSGGTVLFMMSGSGWTSSAGTTIGVSVFIDGNPIGTLQCFSNPINTHLAFIPTYVVLSNLSAGSHTISFTKFTDTNVDSADQFNVTTLEIPI